MRQRRCCCPHSTERRLAATRPDRRDRRAEVERSPLDPRAGPRMQAMTLEVILRTLRCARQQRFAGFRALIPRLIESTGVQMSIPSLRRDLGPLEPMGTVPRGAGRGRRDGLRRSAAAATNLTPPTATTSSRCSSARGTRTGARSSDREMRDELITLLIAARDQGDRPGMGVRAVPSQPDARASGCRGRPRPGRDAEAVAKETLRVRPTITVVARRVTSDVRARPMDHRGRQ